MSHLKNGLFRQEHGAEVTQFGVFSMPVRYKSSDFIQHWYDEKTDHDKAMERQISAQNHARSMERMKTERLIFSNMSKSRDERKRRRSSERARKSAAKLDLKRDRQRYRAADRASAKAAKRERKRIVVQRGYY